MKEIILSSNIVGNISVLLLFFPFFSVHNNLFFPIQDVDLKIYPGS